MHRNLCTRVVIAVATAAVAASTAAHWGLTAPSATGDMRSTSVQAGVKWNSPAPAGVKWNGLGG